MLNGICWFFQVNIGQALGNDPCKFFVFENITFAINHYKIVII